MKRLLILLLLPIIILTGCGKKEKNTTKELTANDIAMALQMKWWLLKVPAGMEKKCLSIGIKDGSEQIKSFGGMSGFKEGIYKVIVWGWDKELLSCLMIKENGYATTGVLNPDVPHKEKGVTWTQIPNGEIIIPNQTFYVKSAGEVSLSPPIVAGKIGFCFTFKNLEENIEK